LELGSSPAAPLLRDGIITVLEAGLTYDICVRSAQLPELSGLLTSIVEARGSAAGLVIDHLGKPLPDGPSTDHEDWATSMRNLAGLPELHVKCSVCRDRSLALSMSPAHRYSSATASRRSTSSEPNGRC